MRIRYFDQDPVVASSEQLSDGYVTEVTSVSSCVLDGRACVVTMNLAGRIRVLDPVSRVDVREPLGPAAHESSHLAQDWSSFLECVVIDGDPHVVVSAFFGDVECWNLRTGQERCDAPDRMRKHIEDWMVDLVLWRDGRGDLRVVCVLLHGDIHVIDPVTGRALAPSRRVPIEDIDWLVVAPGTRDLVVGATWRGGVVTWDAETMSPGGEVVPFGSGVEQVLGFVGADGTPCLAAAGFDGRLERRDLLTGEPLEPWTASSSVVLVDADGIGPVAATVDDGSFRVRRLSDGEILLDVDCPAADLWDVVSCTNAEGARRWACLFNGQLRVLDPSTGRWSSPVSISYPVQRETSPCVHDMCAVAGGRLALGLINGWAVVDLLD